jgi:uncharacterized membrane protein YdbT with pleckstrin-like domain
MGGQARGMLLEGEAVALELRRHSYTLAGPMLILLLSCGVGSFLVATVPESGARTGLRVVIAAGVAIVALRWAVWPFGVWYANSYLLTDHRLIRRDGIFGRGLDVALGRVLDVSLTRTVLQRLFGAGRLTVSYVDGSAPGSRAVLVMDHVPVVRDVQRVLVALVGTAPRIAVLAQQPPVDPDLPELR